MSKLHSLLTDASNISVSFFYIFCSKLSLIRTLIFCLNLEVSIISTIDSHKISNHRVKLGKFGDQVNSDIHLQTVEIQMRRLLMSRLIRVFTVCLVNLLLIPINELCNKQGGCPNLAVCPNIPDFTDISAMS